MRPSFCKVHVAAYFAVCPASKPEVRKLMRFGHCIRPAFIRVAFVAGSSAQQNCKSPLFLLLKSRVPSPFLALQFVAPGGTKAFARKFRH